MAPRHPVRRTALPVVLALALAAGSSVATSALAPTSSRPAASNTATVADPSAGAGLSSGAPVGPLSIDPRPGLLRVPDPVASPKPVAKPAPKAVPKPPAKAKPKPAPTRITSRPAKPRPTTVSYKGRNHMWMPSLGINRSVGWYYCGNPRAPGLGVYRWGCAGRNNVYLLAHAYAAFKPLHDAYVRGRLRKGMKVVYADGSARVRTYSVVWWRLTTPDNGAFAYAAQSRPSMTLQTCVGSRSQYRLIVRLVAVS